MKVLTGEVDFLRESTALVKIPLYKENEAKAGFRVALLDMHVDSVSLRFNQTFEDPQLAESGPGYSLPPGRQPRHQPPGNHRSIYYGYASMPLDTVGEEFSAFDADKANALLDEMGLTKKDADGYRLYPDGKVIDILLEQGAQAPDITPVADLVSQYMKTIGIKVTVKTIDNNLWGQKDGAANQLQSTVMWSHDVGWDSDITGGNVSRAGGAWAAWVNTLGKNGQEPPTWVKQAIALDEQRWSSVSGSDEYNKLVQDGFKWCRDNLPYINIVEHVKYPMIVNQKLGNVPSSGYAIAGNFSIVQMFFKKYLLSFGPDLSSALIDGSD